MTRTVLAGLTLATRSVLAGVALSSRIVAPERLERYDSDAALDAVYGERGDRGAAGEGEWKGDGDGDGEWEWEWE